MSIASAAAAAEAGNYDRINDYGAVKISLASPHEIRSWSFGEVKKPETINYRTYRPEKDGLFCERIFGPEKDWECTCGKYRGMKFKGMVCDKCGVKVTHSRVRRKRMGHIELAAPVVHIWFFKAMPSRLGTLLDMRTSSLEKVVYFQDYVVVDPEELGQGDKPILKERQLLTEEEYKNLREQYGDTFEVDMGADAVKKLLEKLDLRALAHELRRQHALRGRPAHGPCDMSLLTAATMARAALWVLRKVPRRLVRITRSHWSTRRSRRLAQVCTPALLISAVGAVPAQSWAA